MKFEFIFSVF